MTLLRITGGNSIPATGARAHFDTYKDSVAQSLDFVSTAQIASLSPGGTNDVWTYDAASFSAKCVFDSTGPESGIKPGVGNVPKWDWGQSYGYDGGSNLDTDLWFQWEFMYSGAFNDVATYAAALLRHKTHYLYLVNSTDWTWRHEYTVTASDCVGYTLIVPADGTAMRETTTYSPHFNNHPFGDDEGIQYNASSYQASDHLNNAGVANPGGFLTLPNKWNRFTTHIDAQNKTCRAWLADEDTDPRQIISASGDLNSGFDFSSQHSGNFLYDNLRITWDTSQAGTVFVSPNLGYVWTRFYLMDTSEIPRGGRPIP